MLALDDVKALHAVAEECGHRDAAVLDLGVAKGPDGLVVVERPERHARAADRAQKPGLRPSDEPSARSIISSRADEVATDERAADTATKAARVATTNVSAIARDHGSRTDRATALSARIFGMQSPHEDLQTEIRQQKVAWLSCRFSFS